MEWKPATEGVFYGLPENVYRSAPGVNNSTLIMMRRTPIHYLNAIENPKQKDTHSLRFGRFVHQAILEPNRPKGYTVRPEGMKFTTKAGKEWRDAQSMPIIEAEDVKHIESIRKSVLEHPCSEIIRNGATEVSVFKKDPTTGLMLKARVDAAIGTTLQPIRRILDIKTTEDASAASFAKSCQALGYARQAAFYGLVTGCWDFTFLAVEKEAPYACQAFRIAKGCIQTAIQQIRLDLDRIKECITLQDWPSYETSTKELEIYV